MTLLDEIMLERRRRKDLVPEYHYWQERGDSEAPATEYWCAWCVGWYGVPHGHNGGICREANRQPRQCACIDCVVAEQTGG